MRTFGLLVSDSARRVLRPSRCAALLGVALLVLLALWPVARLQAQAEAALSAAITPDRITDRILDRVDESNLATIHGSTHPAVRTAIDKGRLAANLPMGDLVLVLNRSASQQAALDALNQQQYDPASPQYHHWLTPQEFGAAFGVSQDDLNAVSNWLQDRGFTIQEIPPSHTSIRFSGNSAQVEAAFHTQMHSIQSNGVAHIANSSDIQIPAALASVVAGVKALHNFFPKAQHHAAGMLNRNGAEAGTPAGAQSPLSRQQSGVAAEYSAGNGYQLLVPYDMATIYNYKSLWTAATPINGTGQTIALAGTSNIVLSDVATFRAVTGLPASVPRVIITNADPGVTSLLDDRFENTLDVEWSGAAAPGASIVLVTSSQVSQSTDPLYLSESYIINHNVAKIMSVSYGECELGMGTAGNTEYNNLWQQAYSQGIAVFVSSGDSAAAVCDQGIYDASADYAAQYGDTVSGMTSTPYNVSVGGTDFNSTNSSWSGVNSNTNMSNATGYIPEVPWNDTIANPIALATMNRNYGVNKSAEGMANYLLNHYGIGSGTYQDLIPPVGGSGGVSNCTTSSNNNPSTCGGGYAKPSWQAGVTGIIPSDKRAVPDVSFFASNGFLGVAYLICDTQPPGYNAPISCSYPANALDMAVGGTSVSSPVMAGIMALINQKAGSSQGNPNAVLYGLAARQTYSNCGAESVSNSSACYFNDIDTGTIQTPCFAGSVNCTVQTPGDQLGILSGYASTSGYDKATGLGSLNVANVVNAWPSSTPAAPAVSFSPASLAFAATNTGASSATQTISLTNSGTAALTLSSISVGGANASSFLQTNNCGASLAMSASCTIAVTFRPAATGSLSATLSVADSAANSPQTITLSGTGTAPAVSLSPASLAFAATNTGVTSVAQTVTLHNTGTGTLTLSGISISGANASSFLQTNNCGVTLAASASCAVSVTFRPASVGGLAATLRFADNATGSPQAIALSGTGTAPAVSLAPTGLAYSSLNVGLTSTTQSITLRNTGTGALTISSISVGGANASSFSQTNNCGASLAASASCTVTITFRPAASGALTATLKVADNAANSPQTITLSGTGTVPAVSLSPATLVFTTTSTGSSSAAQTATLRNTGTGPTTISSVSFSGANASSFSQTNTCGATLAANASCTVTVTFRPTAAGLLTATLGVADNAANSPQTVALSGTGIVLTPAVRLSVSSLSFPLTAAGTTISPSFSPAQIITLTNAGNGPLIFSSFTFAGANPTSFSQMNNCPNSLAASASCTALVRFNPMTTGNMAATLVFTDNASPTTQSVALSGSGGIAPSIALSSNTLSFGSITAGSAHAVLSLTLTNTSGNTPMNLTSIVLSGTGAASYTQMSTCGSAIAASSSCLLFVQFTPKARSAFAATLTITAGNPSAIATVALTGIGQ
jgi:subtilase family serine protease